MGRNIPPLDDKAKKDYIERHLYNELRWLLEAATEWSIQNQLKLGIPGYNMQAYAMESAFVHARALFEFFVREKTEVVSHEFLHAGLPSSSYKRWKGPLNRYLMHLRDRSSPSRLKSGEAEKDLNQMPVDFADEALRLWQEFEKKLGASAAPGDRELQEVARAMRRKAIEGAKHVIDSIAPRQHAYDKKRNLEPVFVFES